MQDNRDYVKPGEAGRMLCCSTETIRAWLKLGKLSGKQDKVNGRWLVSLESINRLLSQYENGDE